MSERGLETNQGLERIDKSGVGLGGALNDAILIEFKLGPMINLRLSESAIGRIVNARKRLDDQVELAQKSGDPTRASLAEKAVMEYAAVFDFQTMGTPS